MEVRWSVRLMGYTSWSELRPGVAAGVMPTPPLATRVSPTSGTGLRNRQDYREEACYEKTNEEEIGSKKLIQTHRSCHICLLWE